MESTLIARAGALMAAHAFLMVKIDEMFFQGVRNEAWPSAASLLAACLVAAMCAYGMLIFHKSIPRLAIALEIISASALFTVIAGSAFDHYFPAPLGVG